MNRTMRFSSAAMGMVMLAGLAYYQGRMDQALGEEDKLVGAAVAATSANEPIEGHSPKDALPQRDAYFPDTDDLAAEHSGSVASSPTTGFHCLFWTPESTRRNRESST